MSLDACAELVQRGDPDRFAALMASPASARPKLLPIYAFNVEVSRAPWLTEEPMIAEMRLQWWRDALEEIGQGGPVRRHDVAEPLAKVLDSKGAQMLDSLVAARLWDVYKEAFEDRDHFDEYLNATAAGLMWVAARGLGADDHEEKRIRDIGWAAGLAALFRAIPGLEARGRVPLVDGRPAAIAALAQDGLDRLSYGREARGAATFPAWHAGAVLRQAKANPARVADGTLGVSEFVKRARLLRASFTGRVPA